jgi:hypothetical protein
MSRSLLAKRLRELERAGVVTRRDGASGAPEYHLTQAGEELRPIVMGLGTWGHRWIGSTLDRSELDPRLVMWDIQRTIEPADLPEARIVIRFRFTDVEAKLPKVTWLVLDGKEVDLCYRDPGYDVDLVVTGKLRALIGYWLGDISIPAAQRTGDLRVEGPRDMVRALPRWLNRSAFAETERQALSVA